MFITFFTLLTFSTIAFSQKPSDCPELLTKADNCLKKILYIGDRNISLIRTTADHNAHCRVAKKSYKCFLKYKKCMKLFPREVFNIISANSKKLLKKICNSRSGRQEFFDRVQCVRKPEIYDFNKCTDAGIVQMRFVAENGTDELLFPGVCCALHKMKKCLRTKAQQYCVGYVKDGEKAGDYLVSLIESVTSEVIDLSCGKFNNENACATKIPKFYDMMNALVTPLDKLPSQDSSFLYPLTKLASRLGS